MQQSQAGKRGQIDRQRCQPNRRRATNRQLTLSFICLAGDFGTASRDVVGAATGGISGPRGYPQIQTDALIALGRFWDISEDVARV